MIDLKSIPVIRSNRRSLAVEIDRKGEIVVRAPLHCSEKTISQFLQSHEKWILEKRSAAQIRCEKRKDFLADNSILPFLGEELTVRHCNGKLPYRQDGVLFLPADHIRQAFIAWRHSEAEQILLPRVKEWCRVCQLYPVKLRFGDEKTRWGSMGSNGHMSLNTALLHLSRPQIDYIIVHELCHLLHPNHSPAFHAEVRRFLPNADQLRKEIKAFGAPLLPESP